MTDYNQLAREQHQKYEGKLAVQSKVPLNTKDDLATYYSPGVAAPCLAIAERPEDAYKYTRKRNSVAVVSDWSAVLWLGNIGGLASLPVMEGKAILFKWFGNVDAIPICLKTQDPDEIIALVENIAPTFGGINLEDIKAPQCFYIEEQLKQRLNIPVFHDDQHGTAIVTLAWLINSLTLVNKSIESIKIVISWAWSAGIAIAKLLESYGATHIVMTDSRGVIYTDRAEWMNPYKQSITHLNKHNEQWSLVDIIAWADVFIGVSQPKLLTASDIQTMNTQPIVFAQANPEPEIRPEIAKKWWAYIVATGRSDYPNQVNNVLAFPGLFRGIFDAGAREITHQHNIAAAEAIATYVTNPTPERIIPSPFEEGVADAVATAVKNISL